MPLTHIPDYRKLDAVAREIRAKLVVMSHRTGAAHLGGALSCVDIVVACYWGLMNIDVQKPYDPGRDRLIFSKGHAIATLYVALALKGFYPVELLESYAQCGSRLAEHPAPYCVPGLEVATGSLGHGLPVGLGMAMASSINHLPYDVYVVMSDGECNEGSVWEAAMLAPARNVENLVVFVDYNKWQATGRSEEIMSLRSLKEKWKAFGWDAYDVDGHNIRAVVEAVRQAPRGNGKPIAIVAHTIKGRGISFMEDDNNWHYRIPNEEEVKKALEELGQV